MTSEQLFTIISNRKRAVAHKSLKSRKEMDSIKEITTYKKEAMTTKERILYEAMKLFSIHGFDSVSIRTIAKEVGVANSALYKHFKSKQEIFDAIVARSKERFKQQYTVAFQSIQSQKQMKDICLLMYEFQTMDEWIVMFRRLLMMEQFKNDAIADIYNEFFVEMPVRTQEVIFQELIQKKIMKDKNARVMAIELYAPFFLYHTAPKPIQKELLEQHVEHFLETYLM